MKTLFALLCLTTAALAAERPNIVILFVDDLGYADIGPFGATKQKTPNLDRMALEDFCVGHDNAKPVAAYTTKGRFEGSITNLKASSL